MADAEQTHLTRLTVDFLSAYVANNNILHGDLAELIKSTHAALKVIDAPEPPAPVEPEHKPAVSARKSLGSRTHIISMIDGKPYQTLKRHLAKHGLTPQDYRERYALPRDYPMVAPAYSESRRAIAERLGLGRKGGGVQTASTVAKKPATPAMVEKAATPTAKAATSPSKANAIAAQKAAAAKSAPGAASTPATAPGEPDTQTQKSRTARGPAGRAFATTGKAPAAVKPASRKRAAKSAPAAEQAS